jgi:hypothetical protein
MSNCLSVSDIDDIKDFRDTIVSIAAFAFGSTDSQ